MADAVKIIECPRDAWQGLHKQIPPERKAEYLRKLDAQYRLDNRRVIELREIVRLACHACILRTEAWENPLLNIHRIGAASNGCPHFNIAIRSSVGLKAGGFRPSGESSQPKLSEQDSGETCGGRVPVLYCDRNPAIPRRCRFEADGRPVGHALSLSLLCQSTTESNGL